MLINARKMNTGGLDRAARLAGGAFLLARSLRREAMGHPRSLVASMAGAELLWSGISGYCPLNALLGWDTARVRAA